MFSIKNWFKSKQEDLMYILDGLPDKTIQPENDDMIIHTIELLRSKGYTVFDYGSGRLRGKLNMTYISLEDNGLLNIIPEGFVMGRGNNKIFILRIPEGDKTEIQQDVLLNNLKLLNWVGSLPNCNSATEINQYFIKHGRGFDHDKI